MNIKELFEFMTKEDKDSLRTLIRGGFSKGIACPEDKGRQYCPLCMKRAGIRNGRRTDGVQRYVCKDCRKSFTPISNSLMKGTKKKIDVWEKYLQCMMNGKSLNESAHECKIHRNTAFAWRHKILDAMGLIISSTKLDGIIELDSSDFRISYKGNHTKNKSFWMPRKPRKSGRRCTNRSVEQICVPCAIMPDGVSLSKVSNKGKKSTSGLNGLLKGKIGYRSIIMTREDNAIYDKFSSENNLGHLTFYGADYIHDEKYIKVQNYLSNRADFLQNFRGVSTKYLNNYIDWFSMVNYSSMNMLDWENIFLRLIPRSRRIHTNRSMSRRPAVPILA